MINIAEVIGWKFNDQAGMSTKEGKITAFPNGIPTKKDQDKWTDEYKAYISKKEVNDQSDAYLAKTGWYVERLNDPSSGKAIPDVVLKARAAARAAHKDID